MKYIIYVLLYLGIIILLYRGELVALVEPDYQLDEGWVDFYTCQTTNCSTILSSLLTQHPIAHCAFYDLDEGPLAQQLRKHNVVLFEENALEGFSTVGSAGLMHHKFCVFPDNLIVTGTWNPTFRGTTYNDNAIVVAQSAQMNRFYKQAYNNLQDRTQQINELHINLSGTLIDGYICPQHNCEQHIKDALLEAKHSLKILTFTFTSQPLAQTIVELAVETEIVFEKTRIASYSQFDYFLAHNISVFHDSNPYTMHEKMFLIDNTTVIIGSYNPTKSATTRNDENVLIIKDPEFFKQAYKEFKRVRATAVVPS